MRIHGGNITIGSIFSVTLVPRLLASQPHVVNHVQRYAYETVRELRDQIMVMCGVTVSRIQGMS